ncbi:MAG: hypothetical protein CMJ78_08730 [Planctomycetaceae bacterium]|nr:hypothetical protein [Planctomycetaceae bacterium]
MSDTTDGVRFGVGRVLGTLLGVGLSLVLVAGLLILADNLTITLFSIELTGWNIWAFCSLYFGTIACTKLGLSAFSEEADKSVFEVVEVTPDRELDVAARDDVAAQDRVTVTANTGCMVSR